MRRLIIFFILSVIFCSANAQDFSRIDELINSAIQGKYFPGAQLVVGNDKGIIYINSYGNYTYEENSRIVSNESIFDIASVTKAVATTSAVMKLFEERKIWLYDCVSEYIPGFDTNGKDNVRIINLLLHNSGLPAWMPFYKTCKSKGDVLEEIRNTGLKYQTGTDFIYSDLNMVVLAEIIEIITGKSLDKYCSENIFEPLGMASTFFNPPKEKIKLCLPTENDTYWRMRQLQGEVHDEIASLLDGISGNAGLFSTASDLYKFMRMMLLEGKYEDERFAPPYPIYNELLKKETVERFTEKYETKDYRNTRAFGWDTKQFPIGNYKSQCGDLISDNCFGHTGYTGTSIWCDRDRKLIIIFLTNRVYPKRGNDGILKLRPVLHDEIIKLLNKN
ncbi:MAG: serine hydrolase [Ignavibacteria bacterium]|nr:serine hydrolase [Ignavibacteria bacterium]